MNRTNTWALTALIVVAMPAAMTSCEAPYVAPTDSTEELAQHNIQINTSIYQQAPFEVAASRSAQEVSDLCSRISFAVFRDGEKVKWVNQTQTSADFGSAAFSLPEGEYELVIIAHNCDGTATISSPEKITFPNNIVSDTFFYYGTFTVGDEQTTLDLMLSRAVAMVRLSLTDAIPEGVRQMKFYYTGGSSTFSASAGYGCVNSKQTVKMDVKQDMVGEPSTWELYTLPHADNGELKLTISALDANGNTLYEKELDDVPITINAITTYTGTLFGTDPQDLDSKGFHLTADGEWDEGPYGEF